LCMDVHAQNSCCDQREEVDVFHGVCF
jgi:hypothetical protein